MLKNGTRGLAGDGARQEGLAGPGRADEQDAPRQARPEAAELVGLLEELDDLGELRLRLVLAGDVRERDLGPLSVVDPRPGAAKPEDAGLALLHLAPLIRQETEQQQQRQDGDREAQEERQDRAATGDLRIDHDAIALEQRQEHRVVDRRQRRGEVPE